VKKQAAWRTRRTVVSLRARCDVPALPAEGRTNRRERRSKGVSPRNHREVEARLTGNDVSLLQPADRMGSTRRRFSSHTHAVEFSRTDAEERRAMKRPPLAPEASESTGYEKVVSESSEGAPVSQGFPCLPLGRPKECSRPLRPVKLRDPRVSRSAACPPGAPSRRPASGERRAPRRSPRRASPRPGRSSGAPHWSTGRTSRR
jgi:hypothetical protein